MNLMPIVYDMASKTNPSHGAFRAGQACTSLSCHIRAGGDNLYRFHRCLSLATSKSASGVAFVLPKTKGNKQKRSKKQVFTEYDCHYY